MIKIYSLKEIQIVYIKYRSLWQQLRYDNLIPVIMIENVR